MNGKDGVSARRTGTGKLLCSGGHDHSARGAARPWRERRSAWRAAGAATLGLLLAIASPAQELSCELSIVTPHGVATAPQQVNVTARWRGGVQPDVPATAEVTCRAPGSCRLPLPTPGTWELEAHQPGIWSAPKLLTVGREHCAVQLTVHPTGEVLANVALPDGEPPLSQLTLRFQEANGDGTGRARPSWEVECQLRGATARCRVPAGTWDVRLRARGFVSHFFRAVKVTGGGHSNLGSLRFVRGASLTGWITTIAGMPDPRQCRITLEPILPGPAQERAMVVRSGQRIIEGHPEASGFFHLSGVPPGDWRLVVTQPGFAEASVAPVRIMSNAETEISAVIVLDRPFELHVVLQPPLAPDERPWRVTLLRPGQVTGHLEQAGRATCSPGGECSLPGLSPGSYTLKVEDSAASSYLLYHAELTSGDPPLFLEVPVVRVEGEVRLGRDPLAANLEFLRWESGQRVAASANEKGKFIVVLPDEGQWRVRIAADEPPVHRQLSPVLVKKRGGMARVELVVPDTLVEGEVVLESGHPARGAWVQVVEAAERTAHRVAVDGEGRFFVRGLEGQTSFQAELQRGDEQLTSDVVGVNVLGNTAPPGVLPLVVRERHTLRGRVVDEAGSPIPGAFLLILPLPGSGQLGGMENTISDVDGTFAADIPATCRRAQVVALAPGFALTARWFTVEGHEAAMMLSREGGTVRVHLPEATATSNAGSVPVLFQDGAFLDLPTLARWSTGQGQPPPPAHGTWQIPRLAAGSYRFCLVALEQAGLAIASGGAAGLLRGCSDGVLHPGGSLELNLPAAAP